MLSLSGWSSKLALLHSLGLTNAFLHTVSPLTQGCLARGAQLAHFYHALTDEIQTVSSDCEQAACWPTATVMKPLAKYQESRQRWRLAGVIQINTPTFWGSVLFPFLPNLLPLMGSTMTPSYHLFTLREDCYSYSLPSPSSFHGLPSKTVSESQYRKEDNLALSRENKRNLTVWDCCHHLFS